jgi:hypothetical protein
MLGRIRQRERGGQLIVRSSKAVFALSYRRRMITLRCTVRAAGALGLPLADDAPSGSSPVGDRYVNLIPTAAGGLFLFMSEQSLLMVAVPQGEPRILHTFVARVGNLLSMIGVPNKRIETEVEHFLEARVGKTKSRRLLGVMNDLAFRCGAEIDGASRSSPVSLSDIELRMANMPQATLGFRTASEVALDLLQTQPKFGTF